MKRQHIVLAALASILLLAAFWMLLWQPKQEEIATVREETERIEAEAVQVRAEIAALQQVRQEAPQVQAELMALETIVPHESALPSMLRQLQKAADDSNLTLVSITPSRPTAVTAEGGTEGLAAISTAVDLEGGYFQIVDFLRRMEDPEISPRGLLINAVNVTSDPEDHPVLQVTLQGDVFAMLPVIGDEAPVTPAPADETEPADDEATTDGAEEADGTEVDQ